MYWEKRKLDYKILIPPISKPFEDFNVQEAKSFFEWHINQIPSRIKYLGEISSCKLDKTLQSMVSLWQWFLNCAEVENTPKKRMAELKQALEKSPFSQDILGESKVQFSLKTEYMIRDIGMYVGQFFVENSNKLYWSYHTDTDKDSFANIPLISGFMDFEINPPFPMQFEPNHMVGVVASNIFDQSQNVTDLFDLCSLWMNYAK